MNELSPLVRIVLTSKAMKQVIDITVIAYTIMYGEAVA